MKYNKSLILSAVTASMFFSCATLKVTNAPIKNLTSVAAKKTELTEKEKHTWGHLDVLTDSLPGMSVEKTYTEIIKDNKGKTVIVAVIDSGIDIDHEDLNDVVWVNTKEVPGNGIDDDKNGYVDDINGWNFLGDAYDEQLEYIRLLKSGVDFDRKEEAQAKYDKDFNRAKQNKTRYEGILEQVQGAHKTLEAHFGKADYSKDDINSLVSEDENVVQAAQFAKQMYGYGLESMTDAIEELQGGIDYFSAQVDVNLNMELKGRTTGDDPNDFTQTVYGNGNVKHSIKDESHGTHVAGIIAAERGNGLGVDGVANNVQIMAVRAVPNGDEYDKDVALAIRYAADNGAKVMNTSFGKAYSPHSDKVREAIAYAASKDVLIVNAAGNDALDLDKNKSYPNDAVDNGAEVADNFVTVGALAPSNGEDVVASFSNYGKINVDVFAPGAKIYSTTPENEYDTKGGTSMAAPAVAGVAALIRSYFPKLTASQVKSVLMASGLPKDGDVIIGGNPDKKSSFDDLSKSGKMVNAYNAFILASKMSK